MYTLLLNKISRKFIVYCICGGIGALSDLTTYYFLMMFDNNYQLSNSLSYATGTLVSFSLNTKHTFKVKGQLLTRLLVFFAVAALGYLTSVMLLNILVSVFSLDPIGSKIITLPLVVLLQYTLNRKITFR